VPFSENAVEYAAIVKESAVRRRALEALRQAAEALKAGTPLAEVATMAGAVPEVLAGAKSRVRETTGDTMRILDAAATAWTEGRRTSLTTGWRDFDEQVRLLPTLHAIGAHPGVGKSAMVAGLVRNWTKSRVKTGVLSYEDDAVDMQRRIFACDADLDLAAMLGDRAPDERGFALAEKAAVERQLLEKYLLTDDAGRGTVSDVLSSCREMVARGCRVLVLDNMSCVRMDAETAEESRFGIEDALLAMRELAVKHLRVPIIVVGHLKRGQSEGDELTKRPKLTDFAGAAAWERTVRSACGLWWENNQVRMRVLKQTNGRVGGEFVVNMHSGSACVIGVESHMEPEAQYDGPKVYARGRAR
jgi:replicative DNA helicase